MYPPGAPPFGGGAPVANGPPVDQFGRMGLGQAPPGGILGGGPRPAMGAPMGAPPSAGGPGAMPPFPPTGPGPVPAPGMGMPGMPGGIPQGGIRPPGGAMPMPNGNMPGPAGMMPPGGAPGGPMRMSGPGVAGVPPPGGPMRTSGSGAPPGMHPPGGMGGMGGVGGPVPPRSVGGPMPAPGYAPSGAPPGGFGAMPRPMGAPLGPGPGMSGAPAPPGQGGAMHMPPPGGQGMAPPPPGGMPGSMPPPQGMPGAHGMPPGPPGMGMGPPPPGMPAGPPGMPPGPPGGYRPPGPPGAGGPPGPPGMPPPPGPHGMSHPPGPPGMPLPPGGAPGVPPAPASQSRIDPASIPRPVVSAATGPVLFDTRSPTPGQPVNPPAASSRYVVRDRGNAGPRYLRCSLNQVPHASDLLNNCGMPLALMVSPMALPEPEDDQIQVVDMGDLGPVRCGRCKAYMNPYVRFMASGRTWTCNFCSYSNNTPEAYFSHLGPDGRRRDAEERAELCLGSVEYVATNDYILRPPMLNIHFFLVDASPTAVTSGALATACSCISRVLDDFPCPERVQVALATFDSAVQFYSFRSGSSQPGMLIVTDIAEPFVPDSVPLLLGLNENKDALQALLEQIPGMFTGTRSNESCAGAGIEAAIAALQPTGGKLHCFLSTLPTLGVHSLKLRDGVGAGEKDKLAVLTSQDNTLKSLAGTAAAFQICIDVSLMGQGYMDIATFSDLTTTTGGTLYQYTAFNPALDHDQLLNDLKWNVVRPQGMEAIMRVRCSQGLELEGYLGAFYSQPVNPTDVYLPAVDSDKAVLTLLRLAEKLTPGTECYLQAALLYTSVEGYRRIRVHTIALPVVDSYGAVFKGADLDCQTMHMARRVAASLPGGTLAAARDSVLTGTVNILAAYRKYCASQSSPVQLILPEALKLLPLYALSLLKGPALRDGVRVDDRSLWISQMMALPCARISPLLYPRLLPIFGALTGAEHMEQLPDGVVLSSERLEQGGVYLVENGFDAVLHLHRGVDPGLVQQLLGVSSYDELLKQTQPLVLLPNDSPASKALQDILSKVRIHRSSFLRLRITRKGDPHEAHFFNLLVEDKTPAGVSYVEFLCSIHKSIQQKLQ